jgi:hypothetical protein
MASVGPTPCSGLKSDIASPIPKAHFETVLNMSPDAFATEAMGMRHCLPGKLAVSLREADSSRLRTSLPARTTWVTTRVPAFLFGLFGYWTLRVHAGSDRSEPPQVGQARGTAASARGCKRGVSVRSFQSRVGNR